MREESRRAYDELLADLSRAREINRENLEKILADNQNTAYGARYGFGRIRSPREYIEKVPLTGYPAYERLAEDPGAFTAYPVHIRLSTSGSTGKQKIFVQTEEGMRRYGACIQEMPYYLTDTDGRGRTLHTSVFRSPKNGLSIISAALFRWLDASGEVDMDEMFTGGRELTASDDIGDVMYVKTWLMFSCPELQAIQSIYLYDMVMLLSWMENHWRTVLADMRAERVSACLGDGVKAALLRRLPDGRWLDRLEAQFSLGFDQPVLPRVWKDLRFVCGIGGRRYILQERRIRRYIGGLPIHEFAYGLSEGILGVALEMNQACYTLLPRSAFYEFLTEKGEKLTPLEDLEAGGVYEPVITTFSGLYRYRTGDLIQVEKFAGESPVFELVGKRRLLLDIAGEKLDDKTAVETMCRWERAVGVSASDFSVGVATDHMPQGYLLFVEADRQVDARAAAEVADGILKILSPDYEDLRGLGLLAMPEVRFVPQGEIAASLSAMAQGAHSKPQVFLSEARTQYLSERAETVCIE